MEDYALVKVKGFANSEAEPAAEVLQREVAARRGDRSGPGRFLLARVGGEAAAVVGFHEGEERLVFNLATRVPFHNRGLAKYLLCRVIADSSERGCRAVVINTNPDDTPIQWYRRLGFSDEVGWHRSYFYCAQRRKTSH